jgi:hypothetical protein
MSCGVGSRAAIAAGEPCVGDAMGAACAGASALRSLFAVSPVASSTEMPVPAANAPIAATTTSTHPREIRLIPAPVYRWPRCRGSWS